MDIPLFHHFQEIGGRHWWCRGRIEIILSLIGPLVKRKCGLKLLEIGCGVGHNLNYLKEIGEVIGADSMPIAVEYARQNTGLKVVQCELPQDVPFDAQSFDMVVMLDVLEHISEDVESLRSIHRLLKPGGILVCTVPAYNFLWTIHDDLFHHKRRYTLMELKNKLSSSGYLVERITYYNFLLFFPIALVRVLKKITRFDKSTDFSLPYGPVNEILFKIFRSESVILRSFDLPTGVSLLAIGRKVLTTIYNCWYFPRSYAISVLFYYNTSIQCTECVKGVPSCNIKFPLCQL